MAEPVKLRMPEPLYVRVSATVTLPWAAMVPVLMVTVLEVVFGPKVSVPDTVSVVVAVAMAKVKVRLPAPPSFNVTLFSVWEPVKLMVAVTAGLKTTVLLPASRVPAV